MAVVRRTVAAVLTLAGVGCAVLGAIALVDLVLYRRHAIVGASMEPTIRKGATVWSVYVNGNHVHDGEIVLMVPPTPQPPEPLAIRRVVAVGGETVESSGGRLLVNGVVVPEPYVRRTPYDYEQPVPNTRVPAGTVYVLGDSRADSVDSRYYGPVPVHDIVERVVNTNAESNKHLLLQSGLLPVGVGVGVIAVLLGLRSRRRACLAPEPPDSDSYQFR